MQQEEFTPWLISMIQPYSKIFETMYSVSFKLFNTVILKQGDPKQWFYMNDKHNICTHDEEWLKWRVFGMFCRAKHPQKLGEYIQSDSLEQLELIPQCKCKEQDQECKCILFYFEQKLPQGRIYRAVSLEVANELFRNANEKSEIISNWNKIIVCTHSKIHIYQVMVTSSSNFIVNRKRVSQFPLQKEEFSKLENIIKKPILLKEEFDKSLAGQQNEKCQKFAQSLFRLLEGRLQRKISMLQIELFMIEGDLQIYLTGLDNIIFYNIEGAEPVDIQNLQIIKKQEKKFDKCSGIYCKYATNNIFYDEFDEQFSLYIMAPKKGEQQSYKKITYKSIFLDIIERYKTIKMLEPHINKSIPEQLLFKLRLYYSLGDITNSPHFKHLKISNFYQQQTVCHYCFCVYSKIDQLRNECLKNKRIQLTEQQINEEVTKFMGQTTQNKNINVISEQRMDSKFFDKLNEFDIDQLKFFREFTLTIVHDEKYFVKKNNLSQQTGFQLPSIIKIKIKDKDNMIKKTKYQISKEQSEALGLKHYLGHAKNLPFSDQGLAISKSSLELNKLQDKIREIQIIKERMDQEKIKKVREDIQMIMCTYYGKGKEEKERLIDYVETLKKRESPLIDEGSQVPRSPAIQIVTDKNDFLSENQRRIKQDKEKKEQEILQTKKDFLEVNSDLALSILKKDYISDKNSEY